MQVLRVEGVCCAEVVSQQGERVQVGHQDGFQGATGHNLSSVKNIVLILKPGFE